MPLPLRQRRPRRDKGIRRTETWENAYLVGWTQPSGHAVILGEEAGEEEDRDREGGSSSRAAATPASRGAGAAMALPP